MDVAGSDEAAGTREAAEDEPADAVAVEVRAEPVDGAPDEAGVEDFEEVGAGRDGVGEGAVAGRRTVVAGVPDGAPRRPA